MKMIRTAVSAFLYLVVCAPNTQAQFLKKLGKTVKHIATESISTYDKSGEDASSERVASNNTAKPGNSPSKNATVAFDFEKQGITVLKSGSASFNSGEYFMEGYSSIQSEDNKIVATVVVGVMTEKERLSELGEGSGSDVAIIYENGTKARETTVDKLDKNLYLLNKKQDWYVIKEVANMGDKNKYVKAGKNGTSQVISFNGKTYGPYMMVSQMIVNNAETRFYATVSPAMKDLENQKSFLVSNDGKLKPIDFGGELLANINFTNGCMILSPVTGYTSQLAKEENEAKQEAIQKKMADAMMNHPNESDVIFFNGKKLTNILTATPWLDLSGNNLFSIKVDASENFQAGLYLNGKRIDSDAPRQGQGWCNADGTNWAFIPHDPTENRLVFKDGTTVADVIHPRQVSVSDKTYMVWFMYDRAKSDEIKMCSKEL